jgi:hypothetical protein
MYGKDGVLTEEFSDKCLVNGDKSRKQRLKARGLE